MTKPKLKPKSPNRAPRLKTKAGRQLGRNPSDREVKDFIVAAIETSLSQNLEQMGFSKSEVRDLLAGSGKALTAAVREMVSDREVAAPSFIALRPRDRGTVREALLARVLCDVASWPE